MEELLNELGPSGFFALCAVPGVLLLGWGSIFRGWARRRADRFERATLARRHIRDAQPGSVTLEGTWRNLSNGRVLVEDDTSAAVVERELAAEAIADGIKVMVHGIATRQVDDPRAGYRDAGKVWVVDTRVDGWISTEITGLENKFQRSRKFVQLGAAVMAAGVLMFISGAVIGYRASTDSMYAQPYELPE